MIDGDRSQSCQHLAVLLLQAAKSPNEPGSSAKPKSPESVRPAPPVRVRCALARRDPEGPSGQCDNVTESWSMGSIGPPKCKHPKARQKAAQRQCLSWLSGRNLTRTGLIRLSHDRQATIQQAEGSLGHHILCSNGLVSNLEGNEFLWRGGAHLPRLRCNTFHGGAIRSNNSARALS